MATDPVILDLGDVDDDAVTFDQQSRAANSVQPVPQGGVPRAIREAAELAGLDPIAQLYNEALCYAREGHLRLARERLSVLLCFAPDDAEGRLLLAQVHIKDLQWRKALKALDEAQAHGQPIPTGLRRAVEAHVRAEQAAEEEQRVALHARDQGELKALRHQVRHLRSEHVGLAERGHKLEAEARYWAWATAGVSALTILFVLANLLLGGGSEAAAPDTVAEGAPAAAAPAGSAEEAAPEAPPANAGTVLANRVADALRDDPMLSDAQLKVKVEGDQVSLLGQVAAHAQLKHAAAVASGVPGVLAVQTEQVAVLARTRGTEHTVQQGETLSHIARHYYGDSTLSKRILAANKKKLGGDARGLQIGMKLAVPKAN